MLLIRDTVDRIDIERDLRKVVCADFAIVEIEHLIRENAARIKSLLMEESLSAGTTIRLQKFIRPIMEAVSGIDYVEIRGLLSEKPDIDGTAESSMLTGIVPVKINQQPIISMNGIRVVKA